MPEHTTPEPAYQFPGFYRPRYTPVPDNLFDELMPHLTGAELKVVLYIIRRTFGFKKDADDISLSQLVSGITTHDGRQLDQGTGLGRQSVIRALKGLVEKGVVIAVRNQTPDEGDLPTTYTVRLRGESQNETGGGSILVRRGVPKSHPQETVQETDRQETEEPFDVPTRLAIGGYVDDFGREFRDLADLPTSTTRAMNLYRRSGLSLSEFIGAMYQARDATKAHSGERKMAYWFACLENLL